MSTTDLTQFIDQKYSAGFSTNIESDSAPPGLNEDTIRLISSKKNEPEFMLEWRLKAYNHWLTLKEPQWAKVEYAKINYQDIIYYSAPKQKPKLNSLDEVYPELLNTYAKLLVILNCEMRKT